MSDDRVVSVRVDSVVYERLHAEAQMLGVKLSEVARRALTSEAELGVARLRLCPQCGSEGCDHPAPPPLGRLLQDGPPVAWEGAIDLRTYTRRVFEIGLRLGSSR